MTRRSLRLRLALAGAASVGIALVMAFFGLSLLFERHVERRIVGELVLHLDQVIAGLGRDAAGRLDIVRPPADPRFQLPLSGLYWQIEGEGLQRHSRSLWDTVLDLPAIQPSGVKEFQIAGPHHDAVIVVAREVVTDSRLGGQTIVAAVAVERSDVTNATRAFRRDLLPYLGLLAVLLFAASLAQIVVGLRPLADLRDRIARIRTGDVQRLGGAFPDEVLPLTAEVDGLLQSREDQLRKARERASDLAHGFKTPLQALSGDVLRLKHAGQTEAAKDIETVISSMRRLVDHEMARTRAAGRSHLARCDVAKVISGIVTVISRTAAGCHVEWTIDVANGLTARVDPDDMAEMIGNIVENAVRFADHAVSITARASGKMIELRILDDGPGIPVEKLRQVIRRGERLDTSSNGAGLGLSIAESIVNAVDGSIVLENCNPGLAVSLTLPLWDETADLRLTGRGES